MIDFLISWLYDFKIWWGANCKTVLIWILGIYAVFLALKLNVRIMIANTDSIPYRICLQLLKVKPKKGDICIFQFRGFTFIKYLVGEPGDKIEIIDNSIYVGGKYIGPIQNDPRVTPTKHKVVPEGYYFMAGTHPQSLDCRYHEFGLIPESDVESKAIGLIKFK